MQIAQLLEKLADRQSLTVEETRLAFEQIMTGSVPEPELASFLTALRVRGETVDELFGAASIMRQKVVPLGATIPGLLDTCGTGGDHSSTFNISTASAIVVAAAGVPVAKHGNRGVSSPSGSAEVLQALGVNLELAPAQVLSCLRQVGLGFFFAPHWHPAMKHVMPVRRQLRFRTIFNSLGPLSNPAGADFQLLGIGRSDWTEKLARTLERLGTKSATVVTGSDGLDEVTLDGETTAVCVRDGVVTTQIWSASDFGLSCSTVDDWRVSSPRESADVITAMLAGKTGACRDIVVANVAAALWTARVVESLRQGADVAAETIDSGRAKEKLAELIDFTNQG